MERTLLVGSSVDCGRLPIPIAEHHRPFVGSRNVCLPRKAGVPFPKIFFQFSKMYY